MNGTLPMFGENEEWWLRALDINGKIQILCESMSCSNLDVQEDFVDNFKLYRKIKCI